MNGVRKGKSEWCFPFLNEKTRRKPSGLSTRETRVLSRCDDCGHHGDVGRLTFSL